MHCWGFRKYALHCYSFVGISANWRLSWKGIIVRKMGIHISFNTPEGVNIRETVHNWCILFLCYVVNGIANVIDVSLPGLPLVFQFSELPQLVSIFHGIFDNRELELYQLDKVNNALFLLWHCISIHYVFGIRFSLLNSGFIVAFQEHHW